jgi:REP element-mobilizing transposase RayT
MASQRLLAGRKSEIGAHYVVTTVTLKRAKLLHAAGALEAVQAALVELESRGDVRNHAWAVMPDHLHWLFELRSATLARVVMRLKSTSARGVNAALGREGALWQAGYYDHRLRDYEDLVAQCRYIVANPLRAGLATTLDDAVGWWCRWISCHADL